MRPHHSAELHAAYGAELKNIILVEGDHNTPRPRFLHDSASIFLKTAMQIPDDIALDAPMGTAGHGGGVGSSGGDQEVFHASLAASWRAAAAAAARASEGVSAAGGAGGDDGDGGGDVRRLALAAATVGHAGASHPLATISEDEMVQRAILASLALQKDAVQGLTASGGGESYGSENGSGGPSGGDAPSCLPSHSYSNNSASSAAYGGSGTDSAAQQAEDRQHQRQQQDSLVDELFGVPTSASAAGGTQPSQLFGR